MGRLRCRQLRLGAVPALDDGSDPRALGCGLRRPEFDDLGGSLRLRLPRLVTLLYGAVKRPFLALGTLGHNPFVVLDPLLALLFQHKVVLVLGTDGELWPDV